MTTLAAPRRWPRACAAAAAALGLGTAGDVLAGGEPTAAARSGSGSRWRGLLFVVVAVTLAAGWLAPVLGASLAAFLLVDIAVGARRRRAAAGAGGPPGP